MDRSFKFYTTYYRRTYARLKKFYPGFRNLVIASELKYQDAITAAFEKYMTRFNSSDQPTNNTIQ